MIHVIKNFIVILGLLLVAGVGYYLYTANKNATLDTVEALDDTISLQSEVFLQRQKDLRSITLPSDIFTNPVFKSLVSFNRSDINSAGISIGRKNPFEPVE